MTRWTSVQISPTRSDRASPPTYGQASEDEKEDEGHRQMPGQRRSGGADEQQQPRCELQLRARKPSPATIRNRCRAWVTTAVRRRIPAQK